MKELRNIIFILLIFALCASALFACNSSYDGEYVDKQGSYSLASMKEDSGNFVGAQFSGFYFGKSNISVVVEIYSSQQFLLNFDLSRRNLNKEQLDNRNAVVTLFNRIDGFINQIDALCDTQTEASDIYRYNHAHYGDKLEISKYTYDVMLIGKEMYGITDGAFNPAVYRLVDLWGFSSRVYNNQLTNNPFDDPQPYDGQWSIFGYDLPQDKYIQAFSQASFIDFSDEAVVLSEQSGKYYVTKNVSPTVVDGIEYEQWIDLGGIAKGYVVDVIEEWIAELGIDRYYIDTGASSKSFGTNFDGRNIALAIDNPFNRSSSLFGITECNATMSTSGQYIRNYIGSDGVEYSHIIDGASGRPAQTGIKLVSVVCPQDGFWAGKGDCLTTALTVMGCDKLIEFMNGYLKDNGISVYAVYEEKTTDVSRKEILSNTELSELAYQSPDIADFSWSVKQQDGAFVYDADAPLIEYKPYSPVNTRNYKGWLIALGVTVGLGAIAVVAVFFVKGRKSVSHNIVNAKKDKPFKLGDIGVYVAVVLVILILFGMFFLNGNEQESGVQFVHVVDMQTQQMLFAYNAKTKAWQVYENTCGWTAEVEEADGKLTVTFTKGFGGETRFDEMTITTGGEFSVKMTASVCGFHQECVKNFPAITRPNGSIVCSPNRLKIVTE